MKKYLVVYNPAAGNGESRKEINEVIETIEKYDIPYVIKETAFKFDAQQNIKSWITDEITDVVVVGGDGTLNEVVNGMHPGFMPVRLVSFGTGNDLAKCLENVSIDDVITKDDFTDIDVFRVDNLLGINALGLGFDGEVVEEMDRRDLPINGIMGYMIFVIYKLMVFNAPRYKVEIDGEVLEGRFYINCISSGKAVGGGFYLNPQAEVHDGLIDICLIKDLPMIMRPYYLLKVLKKKHPGDKNVTIRQAKKIIVSSDKEVLGQLDGQLVRGNRYHIEVIEERLKIICHAKLSKE